MSYIQCQSSHSFFKQPAHAAVLKITVASSEPYGPVRSALVGPYIAIKGFFNAAAKCSGPVSALIKSLQPLISAANSRRLVCPIKFISCIGFPANSVIFSPLAVSSGPPAKTTLQPSAKKIFLSSNYLFL